MYRVSQDETKDIVSELSFPTIRELALLLKNFVRDMVKLSILSRQQERSSKQIVRAWRHSQEPVCLENDIVLRRSLIRN